MMGKIYWKGVVLPSALYGAEVIDMKVEEIDKLQNKQRTNSLNLGENSWQRNRDVCVGCSEERETLEHFILHCPRW